MIKLIVIFILIILLITVIWFHQKKSKKVKVPVNNVNPTIQQNSHQISKPHEADGERTIKEFINRNVISSNDQLIPKIIHQTWYDDNIPIPIWESMNNTLSLNPDYEYRFYNDNDMENFVDNCDFPNVQQAFAKLNRMVAKADLFRYLLMYSIGGIYLDIDSTINRCLTDLISKEDSAVISRENNKGYYVQWCLMYTPGHPIMQKTIQMCINNILNNTTTDIISLTGPGVYAQAVNMYYNTVPWYQSDDMVNTEQSKNISENLKSQEVYYINNSKFFKHDYYVYCSFKHPKSSLLYVNKPHWKNIHSKVII